MQCCRCWFEGLYIFYGNCLVSLQATALSTPAPPACPTSHTAGTPRQEAAPLGVWASLLTHLRRATRTQDVLKDLLAPRGLSYLLTGPPGRDTSQHLVSPLVIGLLLSSDFSFLLCIVVFQEEAGLSGESPLLGRRHSHGC